MTDTSSGPTYTLPIETAPFPCSCKACEGGCPQMTVDGAECLPCVTGFHETPEG